MPTQSAILQQARDLALAMHAEGNDLRTLSSVLNIIAAQVMHDDLCFDLERLAGDAQTYAEMADEAAEARRAELEEDGHRLALEFAKDKRDEWETERRDAA